MTAKPEVEVEVTGLTDGVWTAVLRGVSKARKAPAIQAMMGGSVLDGLDVTPRPGEANAWDLRLMLPATVLNDGMTCILFRLDGQTVADLVLMAGTPIADDLRAELALMRAELDLLKKVMRAQGRDT